MVKRGIPEFRNCNGNGNGTECSVTAVKNGVMVYGTAIDVGYIILSMIKFIASVRMKRLRSSLVSSRELLRIAARGSDRRSECRMDEDYIVLHSSDSDGDRRDSESDEAACRSPTRRPMVSDEEAHGSAPRGELTFSDADSDEEARGSSTRGELIISDSDSDEEGCGYGSNEPIILDSDSDSDLETNYEEPASKKTRFVNNYLN